ncbi:MAG: hypothetical protein J6B37_07170 [Clostridia bacterium]|nr:hypothetical protein [Clostridia bacterium]
MINSSEIKPVKAQVVQKNINIRDVLNLLIDILEHAKIQHLDISSDIIDFDGAQVPCIVIKCEETGADEIFKYFAITVMDDKNGKLIGLSSIGESSLAFLRASNGGDNEYVRDQDYIDMWELECYFYNLVYELFDAICKNT